MTAIQRIDTCANCKFMDTRANRMICRRTGPAYGPVIVPVKHGVMEVQLHGGWGPVEAADWCGEHKPRIAIFANGPA